MASILVYPYLSPRIVEVLDPAEDITVQEIVDLIRDWEDDEANMAYDPLIDAAGKEPLGGSVYVGITATLQNAQLRFSARPNELETGTVTTGDTGGITLHDSLATFQSNGVYAGCTVQNNTTTAMETVTEVTSEIELQHFALGGGTGRNDWQIGDSYSIYPNVQCTITGGNLVAVDENGDPISPILQSPNVQIFSSSSSSATLQELDLVQFGSFDYKVTIDAVNGVAGTTFPTGNTENPVNNISDAKIIAAARGFETLYFKGNYTFDAADDVTNYILKGQNSNLTTLTLTSGVTTNGCEIRDATITGTATGLITADQCKTGTLTAAGVFKYCQLSGNLTLLAGDTVLADCRSGLTGSNNPVVDMAGAGRTLSMRAYSGGIELKNAADATNQATIEWIAGRCILHSSCTNDATISLRGTAALTNNSTNVPNVQAMMNTENISRTTWSQVFVDTGSSWSGTDWPVGTMTNPVNNLADAKTIADNNNIKGFHLHTAVTLDRAFSGYVFESHNPNAVVTLAAQDVDGSVFDSVALSGELNGNITGFRCRLDNITKLQGKFYDCVFNNANIGIASGGRAFCYNCYSVTGAMITIDMNGDGYFVDMGGMSWWTITNMTDPAALCAVVANSGVSVASSCTAGYIYISGEASLDSNDTGGTTVNRDYEGAYKVWNEVRADHTTAGTFGAVSEWSGAGGGDWTTAEKEQLRDALGIDGDKTTATGGQLQGMDFMGYVWVDEAGNSGTTYPRGTIRDPVSNFTDAKTIADARGIRNFKVKGTFTLPAVSFDNCIFEAWSSIFNAQINMGGRYLQDTTFNRINLTGTATGDDQTFIECVLSNVIGIRGTCFRCAFAQTIVGDTLVYTHSCINVGWEPVTFDSTACFYELRHFSGDVIITNLISGLLFDISMDSGTVQIDSSCTNGSIELAGSGVLLSDASGVGCTVTNNLTESAVWDTTRSEHTDAGTFGAVSEWASAWSTGEKENIRDALGIDGDKTEATGGQLQGVGSAVDALPSAVDIDTQLSSTHGAVSWEGIDAAATAAAIWDAVRSSHTTPGTFGATDEWASALDPAGVASAVWDAVRATYNTPGTFGATDEWAAAIDADGIASAVWDAIQTDYGTPGTMGWLQNLIESGIIGAPRIIPGD